jgi:hypothetical protein
MTEINPSNPNERDILFHAGAFLNVKTTTMVKLNEQLVVETEEGPVLLNVEISADFNTIDKKYHEIFFNVLTSKYLNKVSFGDNPFSECKPVQKRKWYQFWKAKYFI